MDKTDADYSMNLSTNLQLKCNINELLLLFQEKISLNKAKKGPGSYPLYVNHLFIPCVFDVSISIYLLMPQDKCCQAADYEC